MKIKSAVLIQLSRVWLKGLWIEGVESSRFTVLLTYLAGDYNLKQSKLHEGCDMDFLQEGPYRECRGKNAGRKESCKTREGE